jgi:hypothetical protein
MNEFIKSRIKIRRIKTIVTWSREIIARYRNTRELLRPQPVQIGDRIHGKIRTVCLGINAFVSESRIEAARCKDVGDVDFVVPFVEVFWSDGVRMSDFGVHPENAGLSHD